MAEEELLKKIVDGVKQRMDRSQKPITANISNRHFHCTQPTFEKLFGTGKSSAKLRDLVQPGQFACQETITIKGPKGEIKNVRLIGPIRNYDQAEVSRTDCFVLGLEPPVRESGDLKGSAPITMIGPAGKVDVPEGLIIALRHVHMHPKDAAEFGVKNMDTVKIKMAAGTPREAVFSVLCRIREDMALECHIDTDEANAVGLKNGDKVIML